MMRLPVWCILLTAILPAAYGQQPTTPEFEVAVIRPSPPPTGQGIVVRCLGGPGTDNPDSFRCQNLTLANLLTMAFEIRYDQLLAPDWMKMPNFFDLQAKVPAGSTKHELNLMLQKLLQERFRIQWHRETKEVPVYELLVARGGPKMREGRPPADADSGGKDGPNRPNLDAKGFPNVGPTRPGMGISYGKAKMYWPEMTMAAFATQLAGQLGRPVTDSTGLGGKYEISLQWEEEQRQANPALAGTVPPAPSGPTLLEALQDQLGLRVDAKKGLVDSVVIDAAQKTPEEN